MSAFTSAFGQEYSKKEQEVLDVIIKLFDGMRAGDSSIVSSVFHSDVRMYTNFNDKDGKDQTVEGSLAKFLTAVGTPHEEIWDERINNTTIKLEMGVAQVWTDYSFYRDQTFSHCGIDAFQLIREDGTWKIIHLIDTRRKENCE